MKLLSISIAALLLLNGAAQAPLTFVHNWAAGDRDRYKISMKISGADFSYDLRMDLTQHVLRVHETGEAEIESSLASIIITLNGEESKRPPTKPTMSFVNKHGMPVAIKYPKSSSGLNVNLNCLRYARLLPEKPIKIDETQPLDATDPYNTTNKVSGTSKLIAVEKGIAQIETVLQVSAEGWDQPMYLKFTTWVDAKTSQEIRVEGKATGLPPAGTGAPKVELISFDMELMK